MAKSVMDDHSDASDYQSDSEAESDIGSGTPLTAAQTPSTPRSSQNKIHHCPFNGCGKSFNRLSRLAEHERSHTGDRIFKCQEKGCDKDFLRESHLKHHIKSAHTNVRDYACNWEGCDKSFATGTRLRRHLAAHEGREKYRCRGYDGCNETFRKHATLTRHIMTAHLAQKPFSCSDQNQQTGEACTMAFDTAEKLRAHQRAQHDPNRFSCSTCLEAILAATPQDENNGIEPDTSHVYYPTYALLQAHVAEAHPPTCPHCLLKVSTQRELRRHIEGVHGSFASQGPHVCTYPGCEQSFKRKNNLNVHINTVHKGQRSFVCGETDLSNSKNLPLHSFEEVGSCGRSFTSKSSLEEHVRTAHLGLQSRQTERKNKRKAAGTASVTSEGLDDYTPPRKRRTVTKKNNTILGTLTGVSEDLIALQGQSYGTASFEHNVEGVSAQYEDSALPDALAQPFDGYAPYESFIQDPYATGELYANQMSHIDDQQSDLGPAIDPLLLLS